MRTLLLNADMRPFDVVPWKKGLMMILQTEDSKEMKSAYALEYFNKQIKDSVGRSYPIPAVIALKNYIHLNYGRATYNKMNVFIRDDFTCQYCGRTLDRSHLTIDHIIPRSKYKELGNKKYTVNSFENVVTACKPCNARKADKLLKVCGMNLKKMPKPITRREIFINRLLNSDIDDKWMLYLEDEINAKKIS
jgi:5-methylcytosine-specific restriction endonuclease McrA